MIQILLVSIFLPHILAINLLEVNDMTVDNLPKPLDLKWFGTQKIFYYPLIHEPEAYHFAVDTHNETFAEATAFQQLSNMGCNYWQPLSEGHEASFFGKSATYDVAVTGTQAMFRTTCNNKDGWRTWVYDLTDNKSFVLGILQHADGSAGWILLSTKPTLQKDVEERIRARIMSFGFSSESIKKPTNNQMLCEYIVYKHRA